MTKKIQNVVVSILICLVMLIAVPAPTSAQIVRNTFQGGTGTSSPSGILYGDETIRLKTTVIGAGMSFIGGILSAVNTGDWLGTFQGANSPDFLSATTSDTAVGLITLSSGFISQASSTVVGNFTVIGDVGIGTASPTEHLNVSGSGTQRIQVESSTGLAALSIQGSSGNRFQLYQAASSDDLRFTDGTSDVVTFQDGGNVGIGTTTPASLLDVWGDLQVGESSTSTLFVDASAGRVGVNTDSPFSALEVYQGDMLVNNGGGGLYAGFLASQSTTSAAMIFRKNGTRHVGMKWNGIKLILQNASANASNPDLWSGTELMTWDMANDRVGIGTTAPTRELSVDGGFSLTGGFYDSVASAGTNGMVLQTTGSATTWVATSSLGIVGGSNTQLQYNNGGIFGGITGVVTDGSNLQLNDGVDLVLGTGDDFTIRHTSASTTLINTTGDLLIENTDTASDVIIKVGSATSTTIFAVEELDGNRVLEVHGNGFVGIGTSQEIAGSKVAISDTGEAILVLQGDSDDDNEDQNATILLKQDGDRTDGIFALNGNAGVRYAGALEDATFVESKGTTTSVQLVTGSPVAGVSGSARLTVTHTGNVGIATTSPYQKFSVSGNMALTGALYDSLSTPGTLGQVLQTTVSGTTWVSTSTLGLSDNIYNSNGTVVGGVRTYTGEGNNQLEFNSYDTDSSDFTESSSFICNPSGCFLDYSAGDGLGGTTGSTGIDLDSSGILLFHTNIANADIVNRLPSNDTTSSFQVQNASSTSLFYVDGAGNVGIGTSTPQSTLHVVSDSATTTSETGSPTSLTCEVKYASDGTPVYVTWLNTGVMRSTTVTPCN